MKKTVILILLLLASIMTFCQTNETVTIQEGIKNYSQSLQKGLDNQININQISDFGWTGISQSGVSNEAITNIKGYRIFTNIHQIGEANIATIDIHGSYNGNNASPVSVIQSGAGNETFIAIHGEGNKSRVYQYGSENNVEISQKGKRNKGEIDIIGDENTGLIKILGDLNKYDVDIHGSFNMFMISQINGFGNTAIIQLLTDHNGVSIVQDGMNNNVTMIQQ